MTEPVPMNVKVCKKTTNSDRAVLFIKLFAEPTSIFLIVGDRLAAATVGTQLKETKLAGLKLSGFQAVDRR